jgi:hypothetical protein
MKTTTTFGLFLLAAAVLLAAAAEKTVAGPKGGRLLATAPHAAEFFVTKDRKVEVTFYDAQQKVVAPGERVVTVTAEPKSGRTPVALVPTASGFVSSAPLPAPGEVYRVVVQIRDNATARPQNFRLDLNLGQCGECKYAEYACSCAH